MTTKQKAVAAMTITSRGDHLRRAIRIATTT